MAKTLHIHVGPHKTGTTAIQHVLESQSEFLKKNHSLQVIRSPIVRNIGKKLKERNKEDSRALVAQLGKICSLHSCDCLISSEDFAGHLPGRSRERRPYPRLFENLKLIQNTLANVDVRFYFFWRNPDKWLESAYAQAIRFGTKFSSYDDYRRFVLHDDLWDTVLQKARRRLGGHFVEIEYKETIEYSSVSALLGAVLGTPDHLPGLQDLKRPNCSPGKEIIGLYEAINSSGASSEAQTAAKASLNSAEPKSRIESRKLLFPTWPRRQNKPEWLSPELTNLWNRVEGRTYSQDQPNLLPDWNCDLSEFRKRRVVAPDEFPAGGREQMDNQVRILAYRFRGLSEICALLGLSISYLRRDTKHNELAASFFQRLWTEEYDILLGSLPTRWLISSFQTFMEHGANEDQRLIGASSYFFSNTLKAYEAERSLEGMPPDAIYPNTTPKTKMGFKGVDRFKLGGTDLLLNTNSLLLEISSRDMVAGRVTQEFLLRMKKAHSIFSRMDQSRINHEVEEKQFANCWSFFEDPREV